MAITSMTPPATPASASRVCWSSAGAVACGKAAMGVRLGVLEEGGLAAERAGVGVVAAAAVEAAMAVAGVEEAVEAALEVAAGGR